MIRVAIFIAVNMVAAMLIAWMLAVALPAAINANSFLIMGAGILGVALLTVLALWVAVVVSKKVMRVKE